MLRLTLRWLRADLRYLLAACLIIVLATIMYADADYTVAEMERTMYAPARRFLGGDAAVMADGASFQYSRTDSGQLWFRFPGLRPFPSAALPPGRWNETITMPAVLQFDDAYRPIMLWGLEADRPPELNLGLAEGRSIGPNDANRQVIMVPRGSRLAETVVPGDTVTFLIPTKPEARTLDDFAPLEFEVVGLFTEPFLGWPNFVVPQDVLNNLAQRFLPSVHGQVIFAARSDLRGAELRSMARSLPDGLQLITPATVLSAVTSEAEGVRRLGLFINGVTIVLSLISIAATIVFLLSRRRRGLAMLLALGVSQRGLAAMLLIEMVAVGFVAGVLGTFGYGLATGRLIDPWHGLSICAGIAAIAGLACIGPVLSIAKVSPMEVLRNE